MRKRLGGSSGAPCWCRARRLITWVLMASMLGTALPVGTAHAAMVATDQLLDAAAAEREQVQAFLAREDVRERLMALGVDPQEAAARAAGLSDEEVRWIAGRLDEMPAGQDGIGAVIGAAVLIFLILLLTDLLGLTDVFPFVRR